MTIREIALMCGVSRGTVDRVINGRGKVHPETEQRILEALEKAGYQKNIVGRALTVRKTNPLIAVILSSEGNPFFDEVLEGIQKAEDELDDYGVKVRVLSMRGYKKAQQLKLIESVQEQAAVLVLHPINDRLIIDKVDALYLKGVCTITVNSDIEGSKRILYVGSDYEKGGRTAAGLIRLAAGGSARLGVISGVESVLGHRQRLNGFLDHIANACPGITVLDTRPAQDDVDTAYSETLAMLKQHPDTDTLMVIAAGLQGVCRAVADSGARVRVFGFDATPASREGMASGLVKAVICQQPFEQGYRAVKAAFDWILTGSLPSDRIIMENQIRIIENLDEVGGMSS